MSKARIRLAFRHLIDAGSARSEFEKVVFADSYQEFRLQVQAYNPNNQYTTYQQVRAAIPQADPGLSVRVSFAIGLYVNELNGQIPGLIDTLGQPVSFVDHRFTLLDSHITDRSQHRIALTYLTDSLTWIDTVGNYLLLSAIDPADSPEPVDTFLLLMQPNLSICSYQASPYLPPA